MIAARFHGFRSPGAAVAAVGLCVALWLADPPHLTAAATDPLKGRPNAVLDARVGPNIRLGNDPALLPPGLRGQAEPHLIRSTVNPDVLLATFQEGRHTDGGAVTCGYAISNDGGLTWRRDLTPTLTTINGGRFSRATDPVAGAGPQGDLYLQALGSTQGIFAQAAVVVSRSLDGGATWSAPVTVFESTSATPAPDKNWLVVNDYPGTATTGRLVSTWTGFQYNAAGQLTSVHLVSSFSDNRGASWSAPVNITAVGTVHQGSQPVFFPDGSLSVVFMKFLDPSSSRTFSLECRRSVDGGRTFAATSAIVVPLVTTWFDPQLRYGEFLPSAAAARTTGTLFATYVGLADGTPRVFVTRSDNQGATWSSPVVASDQPTGISVMNPTVAVTPDGRTVSVLFMDKRDAPNGRDYVDFYMALSFDGGATWQPNVRLSEMSSEVRLAPQTSAGAMLGDYFSVVPPLADNQPGLAIWCDTRTGESDPWVVRFVPRRVPDFEAWRIANFSRADLADNRSSASADPDADGASNETEYLLATNPNRADQGEVAVLVDTAGQRSLAWLQRATESTPALAVTPLNANAEPVNLTQPGAMPSIPPPAGMQWMSFQMGSPAPLQAGRQGYRDAALDTNSRLINLSARGQTGSSTNVIVGFVIDGPKTILVRAAGPALSALGVSGVLADPVLTLSAPTSDFTQSNDNWLSSAANRALFLRLGAFPFADGSRDAALSGPLGAQAYTAVAAGPAGTSGITLVEAYDADTVPGTVTGPRLLNLSVRGEIGPDETSLIAGFVLIGTEPRRILLRAIGPGLAPFGVARALADPVLALYRGQTLLAANDDWEISRSATAVAATAQRLKAFALPAASLDAALLLTLTPGAYTVNVSSADGSPGVALVEIYDAN